MENENPLDNNRNTVKIDKQQFIRQLIIYIIFVSCLFVIEPLLLHFKIKIFKSKLWLINNLTKKVELK